MFKDFDYSQKLTQPKLFLARPNKQIIDRLSEAYQINVSVYDDELDQLSFIVPLFIEQSKPTLSDKGFDLTSGTQPEGLIYNDHINKLKEKMLIKIEIDNDTDWMIIDSVQENVGSEDTVTISCFSLPHELSHSNLGGSLDEETLELREIIQTVIAETRWKIGRISSQIPAKLYRMIGFSDTTVLDAIFQISEVYNVYLDFDNTTRTINLLTYEEHQVYRGLKIDYGKLLDSYIVNRSSDEIVTRLTVTGSEGLTISNVNPTGLPYIEDFSYFLHPFSYDAENNKVLKSSDYMSDSLAKALYRQNKLFEKYTAEIQSLNTSIMNLTIEISSKESDLAQLNLELDNINDRLDTAKASEASSTVIDPIKKEQTAKTAEITSLKKSIDSFYTVQNGNKQRLQLIQNSITIESNFTESDLDELKFFVISKTWTNEEIIDETELYSAGLNQMEVQKIPKVLIDISLVNFYNVIEEQYYKDKIKIGDIVRVTNNKIGITYEAPIINIEYDFEENNVQLKIAQDKSLLDENGKLKQIIDNAQSTTDIVSSNKQYWDSIKKVESEVDKLLSEEWDANQKQISAGVNNEITMGKRGLLVKNPDRPNELLVMQSGILALSEDSGETWKTAIKPNGIVAERLMGRVIAGNDLIITNESGSFVIDSNGLTIDMDSIKIMSGQDGTPQDMINSWNSLLLSYEEMANDSKVNGYEKAQLITQWNKLSEVHDSMISSFNKSWTPTEDADGNVVATKPPEYNEYLLAYTSLDKYLHNTKQEDGFSILSEDNLTQTSTINPDTFNRVFREYESKKQAFETVIPLSFTNSEIKTLETGISLNYTKNKEIVAQLNLSEEGVKIDGRLLEINSDTKFTKDVIMDGGVIKGSDDGIIIDLNKGTMTLNKPLTIGTNSNVATKDDVEKAKLEVSTLVLSNDSATIPTDENGLNGNYETANTDIAVYLGANDDTINWTITVDTPSGILGSLKNTNYQVINMDSDTGSVTITAKKADQTLTKKFTVSKAKTGKTGSSSYQVVVESSSGNIFKNGLVNTVLSARVYYDNQEITSYLNANQFRWTKTNADGSPDTVWNTKYAGGRKTVPVTKEEVYRRATFDCELIET